MGELESLQDFYTEALGERRHERYRVQAINSPMAHERWQSCLKKKTEEERSYYHINRAVILYNKQGLYVINSESLF